ncbi:Uncharacterised protein r2_g1490 [Pycnogonum litorale]
MVQSGTLSPVKTSQWASPMVTVPKPDGSLRLCADYTGTLSSVVDTEAYPLPRPEDLFASLAGKSVFTKLDFRSCFERFKLDEGSKELLTVNTMKGLMRYERLPYSISSAPAIVQRAMEKILDGLDDVCVYLDDVLISSKDLASNLKTLKTVFDRFLSYNVRLRFDKCSFGAKSLKYRCFVISENGLWTRTELEQYLNFQLLLT